jgi:transposase
MKKKEDILDIMVLHRQGLTIREISRRTGMHRNTIKKYIQSPQEQEKRSIKRDSILSSYLPTIEFWLDEDLSYRAIWIYDKLRSMGYSGSYDLVKKHVRRMKQQRCHKAYIRFETEPGRQAQVDFGEFQVERADGSIKKYYCFLMILGYSRMLYAEFVEHCDLPTFLECHIHAFEYFGGVVQEILYDRMKNVYIRTLSGKHQFNDSLIGFALHYGFEPLVAPAYAPWVKGKVERPYSFIREGFWHGYGFTCLETTNRDVLCWLQQKSYRIHGTTHEKVIDRYSREQPVLGALPSLAFDTSYRIYRKVTSECAVRYNCNRYIVPHEFAGAEVVVRVKDDTLRVYSDDILLGNYAIPMGKGLVIDPYGYYERLRRDRTMNRRKFGNGRVSRFKARAKATISPCKPQYAMDVEVRPLQVYATIGGEV